MTRALLLGASGFMGGYFARAMAARKMEVFPLARAEVDYCNFDVLRNHINKLGGIDYLVNAAGFSGKPNVDQCEIKRVETLEGNLLLPQMLSHLSAVEGFRWLQIGTGCVYTGDNGGKGFAEDDPPNFSFRQNNCSFYSGVKAMAEAAIKNDSRCHVARLRIPFDEIDNPRNYITKLLTYPMTYDNVNSISHIGDFVRTCLDLYDQDCPAGVYNMTNEGVVSTREVVAMIQEILTPNRKFEFYENDTDFYKVAKAPRSNCTLNVGKLASMGLTMRPARVALREALLNWKPSKAIVTKDARIQ